ncbi:MAG: hypothetical protein H7Y07_06745 [Pyrinomonadaceae bacterium]|nr:hypothetical protein [Sphingobacteriaceae bacterium]
MSLYIKNIIIASGIAILSTFIISWEKISTRSGADISSQSLLINKAEINRYATQLNLQIPSSKKMQSMMYTIGDYSFQITQYTHNGIPFLYIENGHSTTKGETEKRYYLHHKKMIYFVENSIASYSNASFQLTRTYFKNNLPFITEQKSGSTLRALHQNTFIKVESNTIHHATDLARFEDALYRRNKFDLAFEGITACPNAKYLIFANDEINGYRAPVKIEGEDEFIRELTSNPLRYQGEKLDIDWRANADNELIYSKGKLSKN